MLVRARIIAAVTSVTLLVSQQSEHNQERGDCGRGEDQVTSVVVQASLPHAVQAWLPAGGAPDEWCYQVVSSLVIAPLITRLVAWQLRWQFSEIGGHKWYGFLSRRATSTILPQYSPGKR